MVIYKEVLKIMQKLTIGIVGSIIACLVIPSANAAIFAEIASASYCPDCPPADDALFSIYNEHEYPFYYVSMVGDMNEKANARLTGDYNMFWYPTVFFDGGTQVVLDTNKEAYTEAILESMNRERPNISIIDVVADWVCDECGTGMLVTVTVRNNQNTFYNGLIRIYVTEVNSRWDDEAGNQYHFAFLDYALVDNVSLSPYTESTIIGNWNPEDTYPDIGEDDMDNLAVFAVLFNTTSTINYANPPSSNPFNAYPVDEVAAAIPENSPPSVSIISPKNGYLYLFNREIMKLPKTVIIGPILVEVHAFDESGIAKVDIYVDGQFQATLGDTMQWTWKDRGTHTLSAKAYDAVGLTATDTINAFIFA